MAKTAHPVKRPRLLDLGCGPGIYAELFAKKGFCVTGVDFSQYMSVTTSYSPQKSISR
ncbi:MAG: methyltransferase domain-containing protein [Burkholderiales bacterium]